MTDDWCVLTGQRRSRRSPGKKKKKKAGELEAEEGKRSRLLRCELHHRRPRRRGHQSTTDHRTEQRHKAEKQLYWLSGALDLSHTHKKKVEQLPPSPRLPHK